MSNANRQTVEGRLSAPEVAALLADRAAELVPDLLPNGKRVGGAWRVGSTDGEAGQSMVVHLDGERQGRFHDFATGEDGDMLDLLRIRRGLGTVGDAMKEAADILGVSLDQKLPAVAKQPQPKAAARQPQVYKRPSGLPEGARPVTMGPVAEWLKGRGLTVDTVKAFEVHALGRDVIWPYKRAGELLNFKRRSIENKHQTTTQFAKAEPCALGWELIPPDATWVCVAEGEVDCMTLHQLGFPTVTGNGGASDHRWITCDRDRLARFQRIYLCFDNDPAGRTGRAKAAELLGVDRCWFVTFPQKDANDYLCLDAATPDRVRYCLDVAKHAATQAAAQTETPAQATAQTTAPINDHEHESNNALIAAAAVVDQAPADLPSSDATSLPADARADVGHTGPGAPDPSPTDGNGTDGTSGDTAADDGAEAADTFDLTLALRFVKQFGASLRWTEGFDWMVDHGTHWGRDGGLLRFDLAKKISMAAAASATGPAEVKRIKSAGTVAAIVKLAQSDRRIVVSPDRWDCDRAIFNTPDAVVDLRTGRLRPRHPGELLSQLARITPRAGPCPVWMNFLGDVFAHDADVIEFMQRLLGYCSSGDIREQKIFFAYGSGSNGKSTLLDLVYWLLGTYSAVMPSSALMTSRHPGHPTELALLRGKRLALASELEDSQHWAESRIKRLTGDDAIPARYMHGNFFDLHLTNKLIVSGNYKPRLKGGDFAMARRMVLIPFTEVFTGPRRDDALAGKLRTEAAEIMHWIVEGARCWFQGGLGIPAVIRDASAEYMHDNDDIALWMDEVCRREGEAYAKDLYASFKLWKEARNEIPQTQTPWGQRLVSLPGISRRKAHGGVYKYSGISLIRTGFDLDRDLYERAARG